jgi:uncharacterized protein YjbI with pentapeptide repeats
LLDKDEQNTRLVKMEITDDIREVISARTEALGPNLSPEGNQSLTSFLVGLGLLNKVDPIISLAGRNFSGVDWSDANLREVDLKKANLENANLRGANFEKAALQEANLSGASLLGGANLKLAALNRAVLRRAQLGGAELQKANLENANLQQAVLAGAYNAGLQWFSAILTRELLDERPDMRVTNLNGAKLAGADLSEADLSFVKLQAADFKGANLRNAILNGATGITNDELERQAKSLKGATMPNGQKYEDWLRDKNAREEDEKAK